MSTGSDARSAEIVPFKRRDTLALIREDSITASSVEAPVKLRQELDGRSLVKTSLDLTNPLSILRFQFCLVAAALDAGLISSDFTLSVNMNGTRLSHATQGEAFGVSISVVLELVGLTESDFLALVEPTFDPTSLDWLKDPTTVFTMKTSASSEDQASTSSSTSEDTNLSSVPTEMS